jgi:hypothetical protein
MPKTDSADAIREMLRKDIDEAMWTKSNTENVDPKRAKDRSDKVEPN